VAGKNSEGNSHGMTEVFIGSCLEAEEKHENSHFTQPVSLQSFERSIL
jgi:hypothetical protein